MARLDVSLRRTLGRDRGTLDRTIQNRCARLGCGRLGLPSIGRILSSGLFSNETGTLQRISVVSMALQLSYVQPKFLNEIRGQAGGINLPEGASHRARLGPDYTSRANFLTLLNFRRKFSLKRVRN